MPPIPELAVRASSAWDAAAVTAFLAQSRTPMRLAANAASGFPQLASVWFEYAGGSLWCAMHEDSAMAPLLGRADQEFVVRLDPVWITAWDYAARMNPRTPAPAHVP